MKKITSIILSLALIMTCSLFFVGCGNDVVGKYEVASCTFGEQTTTREQYEEAYPSTFDYENASATEKISASFTAMMFASVIEFKSDGKVYVTFEFPAWLSDHESSKSSEMDGASWKQDGDNILVTPTEGTQTTLTLKDGKLTLTQDSTTFIYVKR